MRAIATYLLLFLVLTSKSSGQTIEQAFQHFNTSKGPEKSESAFHLGELLLKNNPDSSKYYFKFCIQNSHQNQIELKGKSWHFYGKSLYETAKFGKCTEAYDSAGIYYNKTGNSLLQAELLLSQGEFHQKLGNIDKAMQFYLDAKKIYSGLNNNDGLLNTEQHIGILYFEKGDVKKAETIFYQLIPKVENEAQDKYDINSSIAVLHMSTGRMDSAMYFFRKTMRFMQKENNQDGIAVTWNNMGYVLIYMNEYDSALIYFENALNTYQKINSSPGIAVAHNGLAQTWHKKGNHTKALQHYHNSLAISSALGLKTFAETTTSRLAKVYAEIKDYKNAYATLQLNQSYRDSVQSEKSERAQEEMQAKYNLNKKESEIDYLKQKGELSDFKLKAEVEENKKREYLFNLLLIIVALIIVTSVFIWRAYSIKKKTNNLLVYQNIEIAQQNKEIKDSIKYAKHIQEAILPPSDFISRLFPESFVLYKPKDIVSGDFYWMEETADKIYFAAVDCTGHGVPGAFMSIVAYNGLMQAINMNFLSKPSDILNFLTGHVNNVLHQSFENSSVRDGMDIALCALHKKTGKLEYAGANNPLIICNEEGVKEISPDKQPVGNFSGTEVKPFTHHEINVSKGDTIYLFSDGYTDQFGGPKGKKFKYAQFKDFIRKISGKPVKEQLQLLNQNFEKWRGDLEQLDDVCVMGIRI